MLLLLVRGCRARSVTSSGFRVQLSAAEASFLQAREQEALNTCHARHVVQRTKDAAMDNLNDVMTELRDGANAKFEKLHSQLVVLNKQMENHLPSSSQQRASIGGYSTWPSATAPPSAPPSAPPAAPYAPPGNSAYVAAPPGNSAYAAAVDARLAAPLQQVSPRLAPSPLARQPTGFVPYNRAGSGRNLPPIAP